MYSLEDRLKAVHLYLKYHRKAAAVIRELGYPSRKALKQWVTEYEATGTLHDGYRVREPKYSDEQKRAAIEYYLEHGRNLQATIRALGYPSRETLAHWLDEAIDARRILRSGKPRKAQGNFTEEQKQAAIADLCLREGRAEDVAAKYGVTRAALYKWRSDLLGKERPMNRPTRKKTRSQPKPGRLGGRGNVAATRA